MNLDVVDIPAPSPTAEDLDSSPSDDDDDGDFRFEDAAYGAVEGASDSSSETESDSEEEISTVPPIELTAIDSLIFALRILKRNGGFVEYGLPWSPESKHLDGLEASNEDITLVKSTLELVERVIPPLQKVLHSAVRARPTLRQTLVCLSTRHSFHLLPDEVLAIIFEFAVQDNYAVSTCLVNVSRRFRQIAHRLPSLWTVLSSHKLLDDSQARFLRSGQRPITVNICAHQGEPVPQERAFSLFNFALTLSNRLQTLDLNVWLKTDGMFFIRFLAQYPLLHFPTLESLSFSCTAIADGACVSLLNNAQPFLHWIMPSLRDIRMQNFIPSFAPCVHSQIRTCTFVYGDAPNMSVQWDLENALRFFATLLELTELSMHMNQAIFAPLSHNFLLALPKLTKMTINSDVHDINYLLVLTSAIHAPACKSFTLHLVLGHCNNHQSWVIAAVRNSKRYMPSVEKFELVVKKRDFYQKDLINLVIDQFPRLRSLDIDGVDFDYMSSNSFFPPLRSIRLKNVKKVEHAFFFDLVENSRAGNSLDHLESVVFDGCQEVELDEIRELISKERVIYMD